MSNTLPTMILSAIQKPSAGVPILLTALIGALIVTPKEQIAATLSSFGLNGTAIAQSIEDNKKMIMAFFATTGTAGTTVATVDVLDGDEQVQMDEVDPNNQNTQLDNTQTNN